MQIRQRIFDCTDLQIIYFILDKILKLLTYYTPIYRQSLQSYIASKSVRIFGPPCIVVFFCKEYHESNAKLPVLIQRNSASPNQCRYFTLRIRQWPCMYDCKAQSHNWQLQLNQTGLAICVQVFDWSTTVRKVVVIAENTMSKSETVLEMTAAGLDGHWETTTSLMHRSCNDGTIQRSSLSLYAVLEVVEISHACFVHLVLQYFPHILVNWI